MNTREKGTEYEHIAANYLQNHGVIISELAHLLVLPVL